jgi:hypothetical protein
MPFLVAEISYAAKSITVFHDNADLCKDPWIIHSVPCPKHIGELFNTNVWTFSDYEDWGSDGKQATLTVATLTTANPQDAELLALFTRKGGAQLKMKVQFTGKTRLYDLSLTLKA